jgi:hypothetical protein
MWYNVSGDGVLANWNTKNHNVNFLIFEIVRE